jgi:putative phosphoribosyl transferase
MTAEKRTNGKNASRGSASAPARKPVSPGASGRTIDAVIGREEARLPARLLVPAGTGPLPCVLFVHPPGEDHKSLLNTMVARSLLEASIAALLFHLNSHCRCSGEPGSEASVRDLEAVFRWTREQPDVDEYAVGVAAVEGGAIVAARAARRRLVRPQALVLGSPEIEPCGFVGLPGPVLAIIGSEDPGLPDIRTAADRSGGATLAVVPGAGRRFDEPGAMRRAAELASSWFKAHLLDSDGDLPDQPEIGQGD